MSDDPLCPCNHLASQHTGDGGGCAECLCPGWHADPRIEQARFHAGRWTLLLPEHRAYRRDNWWWEAARLTMTHELLGRWPGRTGRPLVIDVGAEEGDHPALWASWGARVFLVEPNPRVWPCIRRSFEANRLTHAGAWVGLVADRGWTIDPDPEPRRRLDAGEWPPCAYGPLVPGHGFQHLREHSGVTPGVRLDDLVDPADPPWLVTVDVEGGEHAVLSGASEVLERDRPHVLVSVHDPGALVEWYGLGTADVLGLLREHGYVCQFLAADHEQHWWACPKERWR